MTDRSTQIAYVVDQDDDLRDSTEMLLMAAGINVLTFSSAKDLLAFNPPSGGCIVLDMMPDISDLAVLEALIGNPIVLFSAIVDQSMAETATRDGAAAVLRKPVDHVALVALIKSWWEGNRLPS